MQVTFSPINRYSAIPTAGQRLTAKPSNLTFGAYASGVVKIDISRSPDKVEKFVLTTSSEFCEEKLGELNTIASMLNGINTLLHKIDMGEDIFIAPDPRNEGNFYIFARCEEISKQDQSHTVVHEALETKAGRRGTPNLNKTSANTYSFKYQGYQRSLTLIPLLDESNPENIEPNNRIIAQLKSIPWNHEVKTLEEIKQLTASK